MPSNTTDAGSAPGAPAKLGTPARSAHSTICSMPAARYVSAATIKGLRPWVASECASLAAVVVLPAPLTPYSRMHAGAGSSVSARGRDDITLSAAATRASRASSTVCGERDLTCWTSFEDIAGPTSAPRRSSSSRS